MDQKYIERVVAMTHSMVRGIFVVAVAQGWRWVSSSG